MNKNLLVAFIYLSVLLVFLFVQPLALHSQDETGITVEEILAEIGEIPSAEAIRELFITCSEWDEEHEAERYVSRDALVELGVVVVPTLLEGWLSSVDIRRRIELDNIVRDIGHIAAHYIVPWLQDDDPYTRRHAAYLLGDTAWINILEDPLAVGPIDSDIEAIEALRAMLINETEWEVISNAVGALGKFQDPDQIEFLSSWLTHEEEAVRKAAVLGLSRILDQGVVPEIIGAFSDPVTTVRQTAVLAMATPALGNIAFEALNGTSILSPSGRVARLCALEALSRYLVATGTERTEIAEIQRKRAFDTGVTILENPTMAHWAVRGYAVVVIGNSHYIEAGEFLLQLKETEEHPFVIAKIIEALEALEDGLPEPVEVE